MAEHSRRVCFTLCLALLALGASPALAANVRYAAPGGNGAQPCTYIDPCNLPTALTGVGSDGIADGDTVVVGPGTYHPGSSLVVSHAVTIGGQAGAATPLIEGAGNYGLETTAAVDLHDLRIDQAAGVLGLFMLDGGSAERIFVSSEASGEGACAIYGGAVLRDSVCWDSASGGYGLRMQAGGSGTTLATLRNVTAVGAVGIGLDAGSGADLVLDAANVIASGTTHDVIGMTDSSASTSTTMTFSHSNFSSQAGSGTNVSITAPSTNGNQAAEPLFAGAASGDFHEAAGSPTIGAGDLGVLAAGERDLDLLPRSGPVVCDGPTVVDIGAYQAPAAGCAPAPAPVPPPAAPAPAPTVKPTLSSLSFSHARFAVAGGKRHVRKGVARGTTLHFTLSAAAKTTMTVWAKKRGHRHGKACVAATTKAAACTRLVRVGVVKITGRKGANRVTFGGHVAGDALRLGSYVARFVATVGTEHSRTLSHDFAIVSG